MTPSEGTPSQRPSPSAGAARSSTERATEPATAVSPPSIHLRGVRKHFGACQALDGIDLDIEGAQMVGVVGPDGAGKTTLLRVLAGLLEVEAERAEVLGYDLRSDVLDLKRRIGYVPQAFSLYRDLSVLENLTFTARIHGLGTAEFKRLSDQLLESAGLTAFAARMAGALSGGMKQKLAIANALLSSPSLLLLDEPTAGIDVVARREIYDVLSRLQSHVLIVVSTSYLEEAADCDHLVYMREGNVIAQGSPASLRAATGTDPWRAWTDDTQTALQAARLLPWVDSARDGGRFVRIEVDRERAPAADVVHRELLALGSAAPSAPVVLAERASSDLESTLLTLARRAGVR